MRYVLVRPGRVRGGGQLVGRAVHRAAEPIPDDHRRRGLPPRGFIGVQHRHLLRIFRAQGSRRGRPGFTDPRRRPAQRPRRGHRAAVH